MPKRTTFRPATESLEHRRCLTGVMGMEPIESTPAEPVEDTPALVDSAGEGRNEPSVTITGSTISGNTANSDAGSATIDEVTISGNTANGDAGGLAEEQLLAMPTDAGTAQSIEPQNNDAYFTELGQRGTNRADAVPSEQLSMNYTRIESTY